MDRASFEFLYLHAHAIADLAFLRGMAAALAAPPPDLSPEQFAANAAEAERAMNVTEAEFDWSAFEGVPGFDATVDTTADPGEAVPVDLGPSFGEALEQAGATLDGEAPPELGPYLAHVHAARGLLQVRIASCHDLAGADVEAALLDVPADLAPLQGPLAVEQFLPWLERHEQRHDGVLNLVALVRGLDPL